MKKRSLRLSLLTATALSALLITSSLYGCSGGENINSSKIEVTASEAGTYPGAELEYYADGENEEAAVEKLINEVIPQVLTDEMTSDGEITVNSLSVETYELSSFESGSVATVTLSVDIEGNDPMQRSILAAITSAPLEGAEGFRAYFLNYQNIDQADEITDEAKRQFLAESVAQGDAESSQESAAQSNEEAGADSNADSE